MKIESVFSLGEIKEEKEPSTPSYLHSKSAIDLDPPETYKFARNPPETYKCARIPLETYKCKNCNFETNLLSSVEKHIEKGHLIAKFAPDFFEGYACMKCTFTTFSRLFLLKHSKICGSGYHQTKYVGNIRWYECHQCTFRNNVNEEIEKHILLEKPVIENVKLLCRQKKSPKRVRPLITWFECNYCPYNTSEKHLLRNHTINKHTNKINTWLECDQCTYRTIYNYTLKNHKLSQHARSKLLMIDCDRCSYQSHSKYAIKRHILNMHTLPEKWFQCELCPAKVKWVHQLRAHVTNHHKMFSKFKCNKCSFVGQRGWDLKQHQAVAHSDQKEDVWFKCERCQYQAKLAFLLQKHVVRMHATRRD